MDLDRLKTSAAIPGLLMYLLVASAAVVARPSFKGVITSCCRLRERALVPAHATKPAHERTWATKQRPVPALNVATNSLDS